MKRQGFIFERVTCPLNIRRAIKKASEGKRSNRVVRYVLENEEEAIQRIRRLLLDGFKPSPYTRAVVFDGANKKEREILKPRFFPDQVVHWALMLQLEPLIMRGMYEWSCGSVPGRGQARCKQGVERWLRNDPDSTKYCLKIDIRKFYQSVDNAILKTQFRRIVKDEKALALIDAIIDSTVGLNIGNYTSQWFANFYLQGCDHFIKENLRYYQRVSKQGEVKQLDAIKYYARYVDDMVMFGKNKKALHRAREALFSYMRDVLHLQIKDNWQVFLVATTKRRKDGTTYTAGRDVDFLGYRMNHERTILRRRLSLRIARRARKIYRKPAPSYSDCAAMVSYYGYIKHSNSHNFYTKRLAPYVSIEKMKGAISNEARTKQRHAAEKHCRA